VRTGLNFLILALVALGFVLIPGGGATLTVLLTALTLAFFVAIALFGNKLYRENRETVLTMTVAQRAGLYGSVALAFLAFTATRRLFELGPSGIAIWFGLLVISSLGAFLAFSRSRRLYG
jgi:hypothetical protein